MNIMATFDVPNKRGGGGRTKTPKSETKVAAPNEYGRTYGIEYLILIRKEHDSESDSE